MADGNQKEVLSGNTGLLLGFGVGIVAGIMLLVMLPGVPWAWKMQGDPEILDLVAQQSMAVSAWWMVVIAVATALVGFGSFFLLLHTLRATRLGADATRYGVRSYLLVESVGVRGVDGNLVVEYQVQNSGVTPAKCVSFRVDVVCKHTDAISDTEERDDNTKSRSDLPAGAVREAVANFDLNMAAAGSDSRGNMLLEVTITLTYTDVFQEQHIEPSKYGRLINYFDLNSRRLTLYRDVGGKIRWGD